MAFVRREIALPAMDADGMPGTLYLQDCYVSTDETYIESNEPDNYVDWGDDWQFLAVMTEYITRCWLHSRWGMLTPLAGTTGGGDNGGEVDYGTPV